MLHTGNDCATVHYMKILIAAVACAFIAACASNELVPPTGVQTFATHCASCHGDFGEGDGPVAAIMVVTPPNLRVLAQRNDGEFPAEYVASYIDGRDMPAAHGDRIMPVWGPVFDATSRIVSGADSVEQRIAVVVDYIRELQYP